MNTPPANAGPGGGTEVGSADNPSAAILQLVGRRPSDLYQTQCRRLLAGTATDRAARDDPSFGVCAAAGDRSIRSSLRSLLDRGQIVLDHDRLRLAGPAQVSRPTPTDAGPRTPRGNRASRPLAHGSPASRLPSIHDDGAYKTVALQFPSHSYQPDRAKKRAVPLISPPNALRDLVRREMSGNARVNIVDLTRRLNNWERDREPSHPAVHSTRYVASIVLEIASSTDQTLRDDVRRQLRGPKSAAASGKLAASPKTKKTRAAQTATPSDATPRKRRRRRPSKRERELGGR